MGRTQSMNYLTQPCIADCAEVWQPDALWVSEAVLVIEVENDRRDRRAAWSGNAAL